MSLPKDEKMKNIFRRISFRKKKKPGLSTPWSKDHSQGESNSDRKSGQGNKTMIGRQTESPYLDEKEKTASVGGAICPRCGYPLLAEPSRSTPCPGCEYDGNEITQTDTGKNVQKTSLINNLIDEPQSKISSLSFYLIDESDNTKIKIESEEEMVVLNREHLDPDNTSISGKEHVKFRLENGNIFISDVSSNNASFIQVTEKTAIHGNCSVIFGNKIMKLIIANINAGGKDGGKATQMFGDFEIGGYQKTKEMITLIDEKSDQVFQFSDSPININRNTLDSSNNSISSSKHALIENIGGKWYITDFSSNKATFLQITRDTKLSNKHRLVLGNKIFRFELDQ